MTIHLPAIFMFTRGTRVLTHCHITTVELTQTLDIRVVPNLENHVPGVTPAASDSPVFFNDHMAFYPWESRS